MRNLVLFTITALLVLVSCSKKTTPTVSTPATRTEKPSQNTVKVDKEKEIVIPESLPPATTTNPEPAATFSAPMIVIDEAGKVITPREKLPVDIAEKVDYRKITHAFTLEQRKNLIYRFKMVPPRVLFVPDNLASKSARGVYVVYKKKFWYWKKDDALFHLDETYYQ
jgi:biopolymer transport protein ExbD